MRGWDEVAAIARQRRGELGRSQQGVVERAVEVLGPKALSEPSVRVFEKAGRDSYRPRTLAAISVGLDWPTDAIARLRDGIDPAELEVTGEAPPWDELLDGQRQVTVALERLADLIEGRDG